MKGFSPGNPWTGHAPGRRAEASDLKLDLAVTSGRHLRLAGDLGWERVWAGLAWLRPGAAAGGGGVSGRVSGVAGA